jgi:glycerol-3-phosphate dehydrogenase
VDSQEFDLLVVGGGINGVAIARDAARRHAKVLLVEKDDLAAHTSSASSKLIHGGLRYLEYLEFRLVREGLHERKALLATAPHIVRPLQFVLPHMPAMRPWWMLRLGLFLYDLLSVRGGLPRSRRVPRGDDTLRSPLKSPTVRLARYWDAWVDDARLVVLNAMDAAEHGAEIRTYTEFVTASPARGGWDVELAGGRRVHAAMLVNAAGPWVADVLERRLGIRGASRVRLIKGSHIVVPRLYEGDHAYILQQPDGRVVFALPYESHSLLGTTDVPVERPEEAAIDSGEIDYLCAAANRSFRRQSSARDVVWSYSGVRSLFDDGAADAKAVTRDYHLQVDTIAGARVLSVFGGKITTARALAEGAVNRLGIEGRASTARSSLPGGDIDPAFDRYLEGLSGWMPAAMVDRLSRAYGTRLKDMLGRARAMEDLGRHFGGGLYEAEARYLLNHEFARSADDILWRRSKLGLALSDAERTDLTEWIAAHEAAGESGLPSLA